MPNLRRQMMRLMSGEIKGDRDMILLFVEETPKNVTAAFITTIPPLCAQRGFSPREFRLTMTKRRSVATIC